MNDVMGQQANLSTPEDDVNTLIQQVRACVCVCIQTCGLLPSGSSSSSNSRPHPASNSHAPASTLGSARSVCGSLSYRILLEMACVYSVKIPNLIHAPAPSKPRATQRIRARVFLHTRVPRPTGCHARARTHTPQVADEHNLSVQLGMAHAPKGAVQQGVQQQGQEEDGGLEARLAAIKGR